MSASRDETLRLQLDELLKAFASSQSVPPRGGWARAIREALGMTQGQLAERMGLARQSVQDLEKAEAGRRITLDSLDRLAHALGCRVQYALVPEQGSIESLRERRARELAAALLAPSGHSMALESQGVSDAAMERQRDLLARDLLRGSSRKLWK